MYATNTTTCEPQLQQEFNVMQQRGMFIDDQNLKNKLLCDSLISIDLQVDDGKVVEAMYRHWDLYTFRRGEFSRWRKHQNKSMYMYLYGPIICEANCWKRSDCAKHRQFTNYIANFEDGVYREALIKNHKTKHKFHDIDTPKEL